MASRIPLPGFNGSGLLEGLMAGRKMQAQRLQGQQNQQQLEQQWQQHLHNLAVREQQQARLAEQFAMEQELHPYLLQAAQQNAQYGQQERPLQLDKLRAQIDSERARAEKARREPSSYRTPEEKREADLQLFRDKEAIKKQMKGEADLTAPTKATTTLNQGIVNAANNILPQIKELEKFDVPHQSFNKLSPTQQQKYLGITNSIADGLMSAYALPRTDQSLHMVKQMVQRGNWESLAGYKKRLKELTKEVEDRRDAASNVLNRGKVKIVNSMPEQKEDAQANDPLGIF